MKKTKMWGITILLTIITLILFWPATPITLIVGTIITIKNIKKQQTTENAEQSPRQ